MANSGNRTKELRIASQKKQPATTSDIKKEIGKMERAVETGVAPGLDLDSPPIPHPKTVQKHEHG